MEQRNRDKRVQPAGALAEDATGPVHRTEREVLHELDDVLELMPHLKHEREREQAQDATAILAGRVAVQSEEDVRRDEEAQVHHVVDEVHRLDVSEAPHEAVAIRDAECVALQDLDDVLELVEALYEDESKEQREDPRREDGA